MASLTGTKIKDTYDSLLKVSDNGALDGTLQTITDGLGNNSALSLSTAGASVGGTLAVSGNAAFDTNTLFVDAANNRVGVGTASPAQKFDVRGSSGTIIQAKDSGSFCGLVIDSGAASTPFTRLSVDGVGKFEMGYFNNRYYLNNTVGVNDTGAAMLIHSSGDISFRDSSANEAFYWDASTGNLGIGTTSPTFGFGTGISVSSASAANITLKAGANTGLDLIGASNGDGYVYLRDTRSLIFGTSNAEKMRIDSSGNVGIGTNNPDIFGRFYDRSVGITSSGITKIQLNGSTYSGIDMGKGGTRYAEINASDASLDISTISAMPVVFYTNNAARMRIDSNGYVNCNANTALDNPPYAQGVSFGFNKSNGQGESMINFTNAGGGTAPSLTFNYWDNSTFSEKMRITSGGYLKASNSGSYVSSSDPYHELTQTTSAWNTLVTSNSSADPYGLFSFFTGASPNNTSNYFFRCADSTANRLYVYSNGNVVNTNNSYGAISDAKLKENVVDASPKLEDLMQVQVRNFNYIGSDKKQLGVVAQELEQVFPSMIDESPDYEEVEVPQLDENGQEVLDENGEVVMTKERVDLGTVTKSVKYSVFVPMLIKAIQELNAKVESLEAQLNA